MHQKSSVWPLGRPDAENQLFQLFHSTLNPTESVDIETLANQDNPC